MIHLVRPAQGLALLNAPAVIIHGSWSLLDVSFPVLPVSSETVPITVKTAMQGVMDVPALLAESAALAPPDMKTIIPSVYQYVQVLNSEQ